VVLNLQCSGSGKDKQETLTLNCDIVVSYLEHPVVTVQNAQRFRIAMAVY
jgi:hypothetical protein